MKNRLGNLIRTKRRRTIGRKGEVIVKTDRVFIHRLLFEYNYPTEEIISQKVKEEIGNDVEIIKWFTEDSSESTDNGVPLCFRESYMKYVIKILWKFSR